QNMKFVGRDGGVLLNGQLRDGLADVTVMLNDLGHSEAERQQFAPGMSRTVTNGPARKRCLGMFPLESFGQLGQKYRQPMLQLASGRGGPRARGGVGSALCAH